MAKTAEELKELISKNKAVDEQLLLRSLEEFVKLLESGLVRSRGYRLVFPDDKPSRKKTEEGSQDSRTVTLRSR